MCISEYYLHNSAICLYINVKGFYHIINRCLLICKCFSINLLLFISKKYKTKYDMKRI